MDDFRKQFRDAKAARSSGKLSKEQLKALKAQKAAAAAQQQESTRQSPEQDTKSMPPPPPRPSSIISQRPPQVPASFHEDSQGTLLNGGGGLTAAALHSEPSVNKLPLPLYGSQNDASAVASNPLPSGFFEPQEQGSTGGGSGGGAGGGGGLAPTRSTRSAEGSTGGLEEDGRGVFNAADLATSALSAKSWGEGTAASQVTPAGVFPEESTAYAENGPVTTHNNLRAAGDVASSGPGALPKGFFEGAAAEAHQAAHRPVKDAKQMDSEFAAFMSEVEAEAAIAEAQAAQGEEEEEEGHRDRDGFEQFVRMERLRELKEAAGKRERSEGGDGGEAPASALELAGLSNTEVPAPVIVLPKRRKVSDTLAQLRAGGEGSDSDEDEDDDEDLNWRAKKSVA